MPAFLFGHPIVHKLHNINRKWCIGSFHFYDMWSLIFFFILRTLFIYWRFSHIHLLIFLFNSPDRRKFSALNSINWMQQLHFEENTKKKWNEFADSMALFPFIVNKMRKFFSLMHVNLKIIKIMTIITSGFGLFVCGVE